MPQIIAAQDEDGNAIDITGATITATREDAVVGPCHPVFKRQGGFDCQSVVNVSTRNICEIPSQLTDGFLRLTDWAYWAVSTWHDTYLMERNWWKINYDDVHDRDTAMMNDLVEAADIVHLNNYHNWKFLRDGLCAGKRMVIHHHGVELRDHPIEHEREHGAGYTRLVSTPDLLHYGEGLQWLPTPINMWELTKNFPQREQTDHVVVGHGYTVRENKGTDFIEEAIESASTRDSRITPMVWHGVQKRMSQFFISQCDIYFATMRYGPGVASFEAAAMGIPVVFSCLPYELEPLVAAYECNAPEDLPFIFVKPKDAEQKLRELANDAQMRRELGIRAQAFMWRFHHIDVVVEKLKAIYEQTRPCEEVLYRV